MLNSRIPSGTNRTHVEHLKHPNKVLLPTRNLFFVVFSEDELENSTPFTPLGDPLPDLSQSSMIESSVTGSLGVYIAVLSHAVRVPIAPRTSWLSSSDRLPFNLW
jgi:hypothetical protein